MVERTKRKDEVTAVSFLFCWKMSAVESLTREVLQLHSQVMLACSCFRQFLGAQLRSMRNALQARVLIEAFQQIGASKRSAEPDHPPAPPQRLQNVIPGLETAKAILQVLLHTSKPTIDDVWATLQGVPGSEAEQCKTHLACVAANVRKWV